MALGCKVRIASAMETGQWFTVYHGNRPFPIALAFAELAGALALLLNMHLCYSNIAIVPFIVP